MLYLRAFVAATVVFMLLDTIWLGYLAKDLYREQVGHLMAENPNLVAAAIFYLGYILGLVYFAVQPHRVKSLAAAARDGALLGLLAYGTFDMTSYAMLRDWPLLVVILDLIWGMLITASAALAGRWASGS